MQGQESAPATPPSPPRQGKRRLGCGLVAIAGIAAVASAPTWGAPWLRGKVAQELAQPFGGTAAVEGLQIGWTGALSADGIRLAGAQGRPMLAIEQFQAQVQPWSALRGSYRATAKLEGFTVYLEQDAAGRWNWQPLETTSDQREGSSSPPELNPRTDLRLDFQWSDGEVVVRGPGGEDRFVRFEGHVSWPGGEQPGTLSARFSTPDQDRPVVQWSATLEPVQQLSLEQMVGEWAAQIDGLSTASLQAWTDPKGPAQPSGTLRGQLTGKARAVSPNPPPTSAPTSPELEWTLQGQLDFDGRWPVVEQTPSETPDPQAVRWIEQNANLELDLTAWLQAPFQRARLEVRRMQYRSPTANWEVHGEMGVADQLEEISAQLSGSLETPLERLVVDLAPLVGWQEGQIEGRMRSEFQVQGEGGRLRTEGLIEVEDLRVDARVDEQRALHFSDPAASLTWKLGLDPKARAANVERVGLQSETLWGSVSGRVIAPRPGAAGTAEEEDLTQVERLVLSGVRGEWSYHPDRLGALLGPWLPGTLSGSEPRPVQVELEGRVADLDWQGLLRGVQGKATVELGQYADFGLATSGQLVVENRGSQVHATGALQANGGRATLDSVIPLEGSREAPSTMKIAVEGIRTSPELSTLLGWVHPALGALDAQRTGDLTGLLTARLDLRYDGPLQETWLQGDFQGLDWSLVSGSGQLQIDQASLAGSPLLVELLGWLGRPANTPIRMQPLGFAIQAGRIHYDHPWKWTVEGEETQFQGSVGLDRTLDLRWSVPISDALVRKHKLLQPLVGQSIVFPITGTVTRPRIDIAGVVQDLAQRSLQEELKDQLEKEVGKILQPPSAGGEDPQALLDEADRLYAAGDKTRAKELYAKIRQDHKTSLVYLLHRSRIKSRAQE